MAFNLTNVPSTGTAHTDTPQTVKSSNTYSTTTPPLNPVGLALWNWTAAPTAALGLPGSGSNAIQYRPTGKNIDCSTAYSWNVTITADLTGKSNPAIQYVLQDDILFGTTPSIAPGVLSLRGTVNPYQVWTLSLGDNNKAA